MPREPRIESAKLVGLSGLTYSRSVGRWISWWSSVGALALVAASAVPAQARQDELAAALELPELGARARPCVALITVKDAGGRTVKTGTGFVVSPDGRMVTNHHVIAGADAATAKFEDGRELDVVGVLGADEIRDIAILKVDGSDLPSLPLAEIGSLRVGDEIVVYGSPLGLSGSLSAGLVSAIRERGPAPPAEDGSSPLEHGMLGWGLQISAAVSPGSSGSPILDRRGEVVGVAVGIMPHGQSVNFGVPVGVVRAALDRLTPDTPPRSLGAKPDLLFNLGISAAVFLAMGLAYAFWTWSERRGSAPRQDRPSSARRR